MAVKVGVIGLGGMGNSHSGRLAQIGDAQIKSFCDVVPEKVEKAAKEYGAAAYTDFRQMLDKEKLDAVFVCLAPFTHDSVEIEIAERGLPFFIEKPIHLALEKAKEVEKIVRKNKVITSVGYCLRYMDIVERAKDILKGKRIAQILGRYFGQVPGGPGGWWSQKSKSGGQIVEQATHIVDLMRYFCGDMESVYAKGFKGLNKHKNYDVEDASITNFHFKDGAIGSLSCNWLLWGYEPTLEIITSGLRLKYCVTSLEVGEKSKKEEYLENSNFALLEDQIFIEAVKNNDPSKIKSDYHDGLKTLEATLAANKSIENGRVIKLLT